jgi:hypothetical protein
MDVETRMRMFLKVALKWQYEDVWYCSPTSIPVVSCCEKLHLGMILTLSTPIPSTYYVRGRPAPQKTGTPTRYPGLKCSPPTETAPAFTGQPGVGTQNPSLHITEAHPKEKRET